MKEPQQYSDIVTMPVPRRSTGTNARIYPDDESSFPTDETVSTRQRPLADDYDNPGRTRSASIRRSATRPPVREVHLVRHPHGRASRLPVPVPSQKQEEIQRQNIKIHLSLQAWLIVIAILIVGGWLLVNIALSVLHNVSDNLTYGNPRTYQTDKDVGHGGMSHFVALNLDGHIIVVEIVNHEISTTKVYDILTISGDNASLAPVTLSFESHTTPNVLDMVVNVAGGSSVWPNTGKDFQANKAGNS